MLNFFKSQHLKNDQLAYQNHVYWFNRTNKNRTHSYQCSLIKKVGCKCKILLSPSKSSIIRSTDHQCSGFTDEKMRALTAIPELKVSIFFPFYYILIRKLFIYKCKYAIVFRFYFNFVPFILSINQKLK